MFYRFTDRARSAMMLANQAAQAEHATHISARHVLIGILDEGTGVGFHAMLYLGVEPILLRAKLVRAVQPSTPTVGKLPVAPESKALIERSIAISQELGTNYVGTEHLTLALFRDADVGPILASVGVSEARAMDVIRAMLVKAGVFDNHPTRDSRPPSALNRLRLWMRSMFGGQR